MNKRGVYLDPLTGYTRLRLSSGDRGYHIGCNSKNGMVCPKCYGESNRIEASTTCPFCKGDRVHKLTIKDNPSDQGAPNLP